MYSARVVNCTGRATRLAFGQRGLSTSSGECTGHGSMMFSVRRYSVSGKRAPALATSAGTGQEGQQQQNQQRQQNIAAAIEGASNRNKVPKFTMPQSEFLTADLFSQHRQLVDIFEAERTAMDAGSTPRASFKTLSEIIMCKGQSPEEANVPHSKLKQIYAAPASVYMRITPNAMVPEAMRLGPLSEPLLGKDTFNDGIGSLQIGSGEEAREFVEEFFDTILDNAKNAPSSGTWSIRRERSVARMYHSRWMANEMVDPVDGISGNVDGGLQMSSVLRKRKTKMNKHKHRKLRKRTRALRKRLGK
ncbi:hypothetical protein COEREDRAFT_83725 [Coemansia reversa NRRL 1564]|uniref:Small ribosomal subunit protein mS38 n=1 Tax=Coemansia reversa (strain ATCC 12441 / NRRL 1564) TaxID=763665 RepID=A0A2G5B255_COERN|nr:hypothetical protein COEREDRAFT_83725 [Coemansia reversa NRRL 1564]|eukprot:PIA13098.1 hypothetical protein COEREDRAFT_83725 [Coemansia reversa NRRL 1564]